MEDEEEHSQSEGEDGEEEEDEENVLFVDTRLTTVDVSLEEGEIVDEEEIVVRKNATMRQKRKKQAIKKVKIVWFSRAPPEKNFSGRLNFINEQI